LLIKFSKTGWFIRQSILGVGLTINSSFGFKKALVFSSDFEFIELAKVAEAPKTIVCICCKK
jgi:hypothetical protein